jgi:polysaccharide pyruvyl transferase WcaK-like protein
MYVPYKLKLVFIPLLLLCVKFSRKFLSNDILIIPPCDAGSLGDDALVNGLVDYLLENHTNGIDIFKYRSNGDNYTAIVELSKIREGFWDTNRNEDKITLDDKIAFLWQTLKYKKLYIIGADVMDGHYSAGDSNLRLLIAELADKAGIDTAIVSFSWNAHPDPKPSNTFKSLKPSIRIMPRDPVSYQRLTTLLENPVEMAADLAFLMQPSTETEKIKPLIEWINRYKHNGAVMLGLNLNTLMLRKTIEGSNLSTNSIFESYRSMIAKLLAHDENIHIVLLPHDIREVDLGLSDWTFMALIADGLPDQYKARILSMPTDITAKEIKTIAGMLDFVITGRMHVAIATLGMMVPLLIIGYQGKAEGLLGHFNLDECLITPEESLDYKFFTRKILELLLNRADLKIRVKDALPKIKQLSARQIDILYS